jgi:RNA polymerase sigma-70 factor (ECF subfamily)
MRFLSRAEKSRGLTVDEVRPRVLKILEKYLWRENVNASNAQIKQFIDEIRADDLCLVLACEKGDEKAWEDLVANFDAMVKSAARKLVANSEDAEDLASSVWAELYGLKEGKSKLSYYSGRGSLGGWLRAVISQLAVDHFRQSSRLVQIEENREFENLAQESLEKNDGLKPQIHTDTPEKIFSEKQTLKDVTESFLQAMKELMAEDRLLLKLYYLDNLRLKDIGAMLGFHEATASRKLVRVQTEIRKSVEKILQNQHGWSEAEVKKYLSETASKISLSLEKMLAVMLIFSLVQEVFQATVLKSGI